MIILPRGSWTTRSDTPFSAAVTATNARRNSAIFCAGNTELWKSSTARGGRSSGVRNIPTGMKSNSAAWNSKWIPRVCWIPSVSGARQTADSLPIRFRRSANSRRTPESAPTTMRGCSTVIKPRRCWISWARTSIRPPIIRWATTPWFWTAIAASRKACPPGFSSRPLHPGRRCGTFSASSSGVSSPADTTTSSTSIGAAIWAATKRVTEPFWVRPASRAPATVCFRSQPASSTPCSKNIPRFLCRSRKPPSFSIMKRSGAGAPDSGPIGRNTKKRWNFPIVSSFPAE